MLGLIELIAIVALVGVIAIGLFGGSKGLRLPGMGHATLACPHCGKETRAGRPTCAHCRQDL
ncbi:hypothetical protein Mal4_32770 [Maioricimonas rarisocia]|uniref:Uncharacterized protein n=1 Tax=Maioricimonas rarisocia TaxID=2528026 RepID=A0A517Z8Z8_9PLAN|nr:hypothetical protein Mal4_32770 [Maioricimonas rarisocia]